MTISDWTFALGLPACKRAFFSSLTVGEYAHKYNGDWERYETGFVRPFDRYIRSLKQAGLTLKTHVSARAYARLLRGSRGVILFSHCDYDTGKLEFADGMVSFADVSKLVSPSFVGIADVAACQPTGFDDLLKLRAPRCVAKVTIDHLYPAPWFRFYSFLITEFEKDHMCYANAILSATKLLAPRE